MTFIVEDGSIVEGANSLISVSDADAIVFYDPFRSNSWTGLDLEMKEKLLVYSTRYLTLNYAFNGRLVEVDQPLPFPRQELVNPESGFYYPDNVVPERVKQAVVELALWFNERQSSSYSATDDVTLVRTEDVEINFDPKAQKVSIPPVITRLLAGLAQFLGGDVASWKIVKS